MTVNSVIGRNHHNTFVLTNLLNNVFFCTVCAAISHAQLIFILKEGKLFLLLNVCRGIEVFWVKFEQYQVGSRDSARNNRIS
jgi:hypothetical protein